MAWIDAMLPHGIVQARAKAQVERERAIILAWLGKEVGFEGGLKAWLMNPAEAAYKAGKDYESLASHGYMRNVYLYRATALIAEAIAGISWKLYQGNGEKRSAVDGHPILTLLNKRPNSQEGAPEFMIALVSYWLLAGDTYAVALRASTGKMKGLPAEIYALRPDRMRPITDRDGTIQQYEYTKLDSSKLTYDREEVLHVRAFHPLNDYAGVSPGMVASRSIDQHNAANDWNTALLQNMGKFPAVISTEGRFTPEQRDKVKERFLEHYTGPANAGVPVFADGGVFKVEKTSESAADMDWLAGKMAAMREIATAMGIAPELLGDGAAKTFSNMQEARASMYTERCLPLCDVIRHPLGNWLFPLFGLDLANFELDVDKDGIEALQEEANAVHDRANAANSPLTVNERRELLGKDPDPDGDVILVASTMVPLKQAVAEPQPIPAALGGPAPDGGQDTQENAGNGGNTPSDAIPAQDGALPAPKNVNTNAKAANRPPFANTARRPAPRKMGTKNAAAHSKA
jgi:HK97 family phage portal protein